MDAFKKLADHASLIMVSHGEGTLRQFCTAGIWLNEGHAQWFDDINDALKAYRDSQNIGGVNGIEMQQPEDTEQRRLREIERANWRLEALEILEKGRQGTPVTVEPEVSLRIIRVLKREGVELLGTRQIINRGYRIKPDQTPMLKRQISASNSKHIDLYDLRSQCEKIESAK